MKTKNEENKNSLPHSYEEKRKIDEIAGQTYSWLGRTYVFVRKTQIKTWKGVFLLAFVAGFFISIIATVSLNLQSMSDAAEEVSLSLLDAQSGEGYLSATEGDNFDLDVIIDTNGSDVVVARAIIEYDPLFFQMTGWDLTNSVFANGLDCSDVDDPDRTCEIIDNDTVNGILDITVAKPTPGVNVASGVLATISFQALQSSAESKNISLRFISAGSYEDSDVIADDGNGTDILASVFNASIIVNPIDLTPPVLGEITPIVTPTSDNTPNYVFSSTEAGTIIYGGSCSSSDVTAVLGNNTITFNSLGDGTYSDCTIVVTDASGNVSDSLAISSFTIESIAITLERGDVDQNGTINTTDAQLVLRKSVGMDMSLTSWYDSINTGDANCDGVTNTTDAMLILRNSIGLDMSETDWCL
ncbi:MAG: Lipoprotein [Candidatus Moranbacteria bacterium GW2011_GWE2_35_2-]|nr:MAG: Lipoprotein [Candidatus Moranbacteria bacterium GW2011_GWE2_35_2-]KKQ04478.1 MAG: Lipoprotein [Candidatus Moranbacteria bacterium GW2011_GWF1_36_4]KKQ21963.1 MAG: Lipoprotein [Candidatus Moranbacteria bacterium GW2011_GWF2_37_11]KKQ28415.1 MAG: Lipoprotein [Candidatus Moranbacteria bacterium GW2011_GWD1_37_17]KKQ31069.1 MAG: Lipoprotein [Candidatus Moranbacteria bacterium GW2011_GWE1_37_24]KKQ46565.1 MAG: Lipoprotein [Candidatus Moranbacteria bacterium GW2011_GWD2_37_9]HBO16735.1 hypo